MSDYDKLTRIEEISVMHVAKALQINGRQGVEILQYYIKKAGTDLELQSVLENCLRICLNKGLIYTFVESSQEANKIEIRKWIAQVRRHLKYEGSAYSPLSYTLPLGFRKPSIEGVEAHKFIAGNIVREAIDSVPNLKTIRKRRSDEMREKLLRGLAEREREDEPIK